MNKRPKGIYILDEDPYDMIYAPRERAAIAELIDLHPLRLDNNTWQDALDVLTEVEVIMSGWGMVNMDEAFLKAVPNLKHVFYGAGSVRYFYSQAALETDIGISSAWQANAIPVIEFSHAAILLSLKKIWRCNRMLQESRTWKKPIPIPGAFRSTVGLVSLGVIGRGVAERLKSHDLTVTAYDPYLSDSEADKLGITKVSLEQLFSESDIISLHTPLLPATRGMVTRELLLSMKPNASLLNTSRGGIIDEAALVDVLRERQDVDAFIDVIIDEEDCSANPIFDLPNAFLTPHIAGSIDNECQRMGEYMLDELKCYLAGEPLKYLVTRELFKTMA